MKIQPEFHIAVLAHRDGLDLDTYGPMKPCPCGSGKTFLSCHFEERPMGLREKITRLGLEFLKHCRNKNAEKALNTAKDYNHTLSILKIVDPDNFGKRTLIETGEGGEG